MMAYGPGAKITLCEMGEMWSYILNNDEIYQTHCSQPNIIDEIVYDLNASISWDASKLFDADVRIKSGTHISATCDVLFYTG